MGRVISIAMTYKDAFSNPSKNTIKALQDIKREANKAGGDIIKAGQGIASAGSTLTKTVTAPIIGVAAASVKTAATFEASMSNVKAITGATGSDFTTLKDKAKELGASTAWSANEVAQAMQYTGMAGWTAQQNVDGLKGILDLASASGTELALTSDIMTDAISAFGDTAADSGRYADVMTKACTSANVSVETLGESYKYVGAIAGTMGYSIEDTTTALAAMGNMGIKGSTAGTALKNAISNLAAPTGEAAKAMKTLGISMTESDGSMKPLGSVIANLKQSFSGLSESEQAAYAKQLFGKQAMAGMLALINTSTDDYNKLADGIANSGGAADTAAKTQLDNLNGQLTLLKSALEGAAITIGEKLTPYISQAVGWVQKATNWFNNLSDAQISNIMKWAGIAAAVGPALLIFGKLVIGVGQVVKTFGLISGAVAKASGVMAVLTGPAGIVIGVLLAVVAAGVLVWKNWDKIKAKMAPIGAFMKKTLSGVGLSVNGLKNTFSGLAAKLAPIGAKIKAMMTAIFTNPAVMKGIEMFKVKIAVVFGAVAGVISGVVKSISTIIGGLIDVFSGVITFITGVFSGSWSQAWDGVVQIFGGIFQTIVGIASVPINAIVGMVNGVISAINSVGFTIPDWVPVVGGKSFSVSIPSLPYLAHGTDDWKGGLATINERGGEIVDLPNGSRVIPHDKSLEMAAASGRSTGGKNITINISKLAENLAVRSDADIDRIAQALANKLENVANNMGVA